MLSYIGAALKTILHFCYKRFNQAVLEKSQNMLFTFRNNGLNMQLCTDDEPELSKPLKLNVAEKKYISTLLKCSTIRLIN